MAKRQFQLTDDEIEHFRQRESRTRDVHELKRLQATRLYGSSMALSQIMSGIGCGESSVRQWAMDYRAKGLAGLRSQWKGGNRDRLTEAQREAIKTKLHQYRPLDLGVSQAEYWTVSDLAVMVEGWFGVIYKESGRYQALLHTSGFSYQRTTKVYRSQPSARIIADFEAELEKK